MVANMEIFYLERRRVIEQVIDDQCFFQSPPGLLQTFPFWLFLHKAHRSRDTRAIAHLHGINTRLEGI